MTLAKISIALAVVGAFASQIVAHPEYRLLIPNAMDVNGYEAIGHIDKGHGKRNAFGSDFSSAGKKWTVSLCQKDSDGDGQTNGQELGDPCCQWIHNTNEKVLWIDGVSAPGDPKSKSDPTKWANVTCPPLPPTEAPSISSQSSGKIPMKVSVVTIVLMVVITAVYGM